MNGEISSNQDSGPLLLLQECVASNCQVLVLCRDNKKILGRLKAYDRHSNLLLTDAREFYYEKKKSKSTSGDKKNKATTETKDRFFQSMILRGDNVVVVLKNPM